MELLRKRIRFAHGDVGNDRPPVDLDESSFSAAMRLRLCIAESEIDILYFDYSCYGQTMEWKDNLSS